MRRLFRITQKKPGLAPGTVDFVGEKKVDQVRIQLVDYDPSHVDEREIAAVDEMLPFRDAPTVSWININGLHDTETLTTLGEHFGLHPLVLEDIVSTHQRPKMEDYEDYVYIVCRTLHFKDETRQIDTEQVSLILGENYILSFQEFEGDVFDPVRERIRLGRGRIRKAGPDYLAYALLDAVVDHYFVILERLSEQIETLEDELLSEPTTELLQAIHNLKREMVLVRRSVWPLREVLGSLAREESSLVREETTVFMRDVYDHAIQVADVVESFRDMLSGLQDLYLSSISNKMNEVMKVLTIIATIFVPLTFVAGIYGMNFDNMPELHWKWGYFGVWIVMLAIGIVMLIFFRRRRWL